ncbi:MAG: thioesterase family protein [Cyclobacteriaceae bacterium]|nr:thioesterase family protein [Cyclobacteriaceae bacterium]
MTVYSQHIQIRWADIDANRHLRHSAYYDYGAAVRMMFLSSHGLTTQKLEEFQIGPILFREEAIFRREIVLEDKIFIDVEMVKATPDLSRWSLRHNFLKEDGSRAALLNIDGAWIDMAKRKLTAPNEFIQKIFLEIPKATGFEWSAITQK